MVSKAFIRYLNVDLNKFSADRSLKTVFDDRAAILFGILVHVEFRLRAIAVIKLFLFPSTQDESNSSVQFSSVAQPCPTLCNPMNDSTPGSHIVVNL